MASNILQNSQRGLLFMNFLTIFISFIFITLKLIKKKIDIGDSQANDDPNAKYADGPKPS